MRENGVLSKYLYIFMIYILLIIPADLNADWKNNKKSVYITKKSRGKVDYTWSNDRSDDFYEEKFDGIHHENEYNEKNTSSSTDNYRKKRSYGKKRKINRKKVKSQRKDRKKIATKTAKRKKNYKKNRNYKKYRVKKGDSLYKISRKFKISLSSLCSINRITNKNKVNSGTWLKIPLKSKRIKKSNKVWTKKKKKKKSSKSNIVSKKRPKFKWPVKKVVHCKRDGLNGVRPIGIIITGRPGSRVTASAPGVVKKVGHMRGFGRYIVVKHAGHYATVYSNLDRISVTQGDRIGSGSVIGRVSKNNKLHFQIDYAGKPKNPLKYLPKRS